MEGFPKIPSFSRNPKWRIPKIPKFSRKSSWRIHLGIWEKLLDFFNPNWGLRSYRKNLNWLKESHSFKFSRPYWSVLRSVSCITVRWVGLWRHHRCWYSSSVWLYVQCCIHTVPNLNRTCWEGWNWTLQLAGHKRNNKSLVNYSFKVTCLFYILSWMSIGWPKYKMYSE